MESLSPVPDTNAVTNTPLCFSRKMPETSEIDWFNFETRMRKTVAEMLEPLQKAADDDRDGVIALQAMLSQMEKRVQDLSLELERTDAKTTQVMELKLKVQTLVS